MSQLQSSLQHILPELTITLFIVLVLLADLVLPGDEEYEELRGSDTVALMGVTFALIVTIWFFPPAAHRGGGWGWGSSGACCPSIPSASS